MSAVIHDFRADVARSESLSDESSWIEFYRKIWPDMVACVAVRGACALQRWGIDRVIYLPNRQQGITIDEKKRDKDYGDFIIEVWSVWRNGRSDNKLDWTLDDNKVCDFVAYAVVPAKTCWLLPFVVLRLACRANLQRWTARFRERDKYQRQWLIAHNGDYETRSIPVSFDDLFAAMREVQTRGFGSELPLPPKRIDAAGQCVFGWGEMP